MKIDDLRSETDGETLRLSARVEWEDSPRPEQRLSFSIRGDLRDAVEPAPEAFALSAALAAARAGERRVWIDGTLCPVFSDGLRSAFRLLDAWNGGARSSVSLEPARGFRARARPAPAAAFFLSGGVDSLHVLRRNRLDFPRSHRASLRTVLHVPAFGFTGEAAPAAERNIAQRAWGSVSRIAEAEDLRLVVVESDARRLDPDRHFFILETHGSLLAAVAHFFPSALTSVSIAASADLRRTYRPWGSHPLLDPLYGSATLAIRHSGHEYSRLEKVAELSRWNLALSTLLVCNESPLDPGVVNCGRCEKCLRTLLELFVVGALEDASTFAVRDVTAERVRNLPTVDGYVIRRWEDLRRELGNRDDLVRAIDDWIARIRASQDWAEHRGWKGRLRRLDQSAFGGRLLALRRRLSPA